MKGLKFEDIYLLVHVMHPNVCFGLGLLNVIKKKKVLYCCISLVPFMIKICCHVMRRQDMFFFLPTYFDLCIYILELV